MSCNSYNELQHINIIAQDDDCDYQESGYVCYFDSRDEKFYLDAYSHCSCYGTWESNNTVWSGTKQELIDLAKNCGDPVMWYPNKRKAVDTDWDFDHLTAVYAQILEFFKNEIEES